MTDQKNKKIILAITAEYLMGLVYTPPLTLAYIASCLEREGYDAEIIDSNLEKYNISKAAKVIVSKKPDAVGITARSGNRFDVVELSRKIKKLNPDIFIFVGGPHFSVTAEDALYNIPTIDVVVTGEGELTSAELLNSYFSKKPLHAVKGIVFRDNENNKKIIKTQKRPVLKDLDSLPMPAYHLLKLKKYSPLASYLTNLTKEERKLPAAAVISSRGCPNSCIFCANNSETIKTLFRKRNPEKFVDEIQYLNKKYGSKMFIFWDDTFTLSKQHILDVCNEIIHRALEIKWYALARVNTVDREILIKMKDAGCIALLYGAESGSKRILELIKKNITVEQIRKAVRDSVEVGMDVLVAFMISFPEETSEDVEETFSLIKELRSYGEKVLIMDLAPTIIYPGTAIEKIALSEGKVFPKDFSWNKKYEFRKNRQLFTVPYVPIYTQQLTLEEIMAFRLKNKYQQRIKQPKIKIFSKAIRFITGIRSFEDLKTFFLIIFTSLKSINKKIKA